MSTAFNNETELFPGDTVQVEGGVCMVEAVGTSTADLLPLAGGKPRTHANRVARNLILKRGGKAALDEFLNKTKQPTKGRDVKTEELVKLEPGDRLCHGGKIKTVVAVTETGATIEGEDGVQFLETRRVNRFLFTNCKSSAFVRLDEQQRAAHLKDFLARRPQAATGNNETKSGEENEDMSRKSKKETNGKNGDSSKRATDEAVLAFIKAQRKADDKVKLGGLVKAFRASGQSCSQQRMAALFAKG